MHVEPQSLVDGRYELGRKLGEGGMGAVYEATQLAIGRRVAVKLMHAKFGADDGFRRRFEIEAKAIGSLNHPNILTIHDFGYCSALDAYFMVTEYVDGEVLTEFTQRGPSFEDKVALCRVIAATIHYAHNRGILHRDLKPDNIMVVRGPEGALSVKVLDFGLARLFAPHDTLVSSSSEDSMARLTAEGQIFGTPAYMSPEQCRGVLDVGTGADL